MSFAAATGELQAALEALSGIREYADPRIDSMRREGGAKIDGSYLLKADKFRPWPEASKSARLMLATMRLEVCTLLTTDELTQLGTVSSRAKAIFDALQYTSHTNGCVVNAQSATMQRFGKDRRMIWTWIFDLRYTEA